MQRAMVMRDVAVRAADPQRLAEWYATHLGIDLRYEEAEQRPFASAPSTPAIRLLPADPAQPPGNWSITLAVEDLAAVSDQLNAAGINVGSVQRMRGGDYVDLDDPEGHAIRLWEVPETDSRVRSSDEAAVRVIGGDYADERPLPADRGRGRDRWIKWGPLGLVLIAVLAAVFVIEPDAKSQLGATEPSVTTTPAPGTTHVREEAREQRAVRASDVGHPILGISAGWELFASGAGSVVHVEFARGRVTTTEVPGLSGSGPVSLVVAPDRLLVRPNSSASGYVIPDGQAPREARLEQAQAGSLFPGPKPGQVWVTTGSPLAPELSLRNLDGSPTGVSIEYSAGEFRPLVADARGNVLLDGVGGKYLASPDGLRKVAEGALLAVGPTHLLLLQCDGEAQCSEVVIDRDTGASHRVPVKCVDCDYPIGVISPDGSMAAVVRPASTYRSTLRVIDLASGDVRHLTQMRGPYYGGAMAWSPDGRWLFTASRGSLYAFDTQTWQRHRLDFDLPPVSQVEVRAAESSN